MSRRANPGHDASRTARHSAGPVLAVLVGAALLAGGCGTMCDWVHNGFKVGPNYCRPPAPVAKEWIEGNDPRAQGPPPRNGEWWEVFRDPVLTSLVDRAYQQNPNLRAVGTRVLQARAQQAISVGNFLPQTQQVRGLYDYGTFGGDPTHISLTSFNLSWELDFWGKYRRQIESANATLDASVENYDDALVTLLADVGTNYVQYRVAQQRIKIARANLRTQENLVALAERQQKVGTSTLLDVEQLRTLMEQTASTIPQQQILQGQANDRLCTLIGEPPHDLEPELGPGPDLGSRPLPLTPLSLAAGVPADLLRRRPDVRSAERQVAAQNPQIGVATAALFPSLSIGTQQAYADILLPPALAAHGFLSLFTPQFTWDVLNYGRLCNNVHLQDARTRELVATFQNRVLTAAQEVQTALRGFLRSQEQAEHLERSAAAAASATKIEEQLFRTVKADVNRLFTLENSQLQEQDNVAVVQGNIALNLIDVYRALGGGWELRTRKDNCGPAPTPTAAVQGEAPAPPATESLPAPRTAP